MPEDNETYRTWWSMETEAQGVRFDEGQRAWNACKSELIKKINDENFLFNLRSENLNNIGSTSLIAEEMRKLVNEL